MLASVLIGFILAFVMLALTLVFFYLYSKTEDEIYVFLSIITVAATIGLFVSNFQRQIDMEDGNLIKQLEKEKTEKK